MFLLHQHASVTPYQQAKNEDIGGEEETAVSKTLNFSVQPIQFDNQ